MELKDNKRLLLSMVSFGGLLVLFVCAEMNYIYHYFKSNRVIHEGATVEAVVSEVRLGSGRGMSPHIIYVDYEINGVKYTHVSYGVDESRSMSLGDSCVAFYDTKNPGFATAQYSPDIYKRSIENMGCLIVFAIVCAWFAYYIKSGEMTEERLTKSLLVVVITLVIIMIIVVKNEI